MYYPSSKIITNQFTNGEELVYKTNGIFYTGYYHILSNNKIFSGKNPNDGNPQELIFPTDETTKPEEIVESPLPSEESETYSYSSTSTVYDSIREKSKIQPPNFSLLEPKYYSPSPNYPSFTRYFVKRTNNNLYIEVSKSTYNFIVDKDRKWNWASYIPFQIPWTTSGNSIEDVIRTNKNIVLLTEQRLKLYGFSKYITDYSEFYI
jgi:hypothetical protein